MRNFSTILPDYDSIVHKQQNNDRQIRFIAPIRSSNRSISSTSRKLDHTSEVFYGQAELDSHTDTTVPGRNCNILHQTEISCDVAPFSDTYEPIKDVDIVSADTGFTSVTGQQYILLFHVPLYMSELDHTLINPNQLDQLHTQFQDNPHHTTEPMNITNPSRYFTACLEFKRINVFLNTWFPTQIDLAAFPHIELTSRQLWNPHQIEFPSTKYYVKEEVEARDVSSIGIKFHQSIEDGERQISDVEDIIFNIQRFNQRLVANVQISGKQVMSIESATR